MYNSLIIAEKKKSVVEPQAKSSDSREYFAASVTVPVEP
jgi:hypothetical protein